MIDINCPKTFLEDSKTDTGGEPWESREQDLESFYSPKQAAAYLGCSRQTIYNWICLGKLKAYRVAGAKLRSRVRLKKSDVVALIGD